MNSWKPIDLIQMTFLLLYFSITAVPAQADSSPGESKMLSATVIGIGGSLVGMSVGGTVGAAPGVAISSAGVAVSSILFSDGLSRGPSGCKLLIENIQRDSADFLAGDPVSDGVGQLTPLLSEIFARTRAEFASKYGEKFATSLTDSQIAAAWLEL